MRKLALMVLTCLCLSGCLNIMPNVVIGGHQTIELRLWEKSYHELQAAQQKVERDALQEALEKVKGLRL